MPNSKNDEEVQKAWSYLKDRFGVEKKELNTDIRKINGDFWLLKDTNEDISSFEFETKGIRCIRDMNIGLKPTTYFIQYLGDKITNNRVDLNKRELETLLDREMIERTMAEKGYVALFYKDKAIGCGFYKDELISSRIPKGRSKEFKQLI